MNVCYKNTNLLFSYDIFIDFISVFQGYDNTESFIITQDPIIDVTVVDFWRMVSEQNLSTIVMLSSAVSIPGWINNFSFILFPVGVMNNFSFDQ